MIVEDEPDIGVIVMQMLSNHYEVVHAANGLEALERLSWYQPDLTIMDLMMPVLDGFDTTRAIKKDNDYTTMPVMFLTARKDNKAVREALMAGGDVYLEKPFDPPELLVRLQEMITRNNLTPKPKRHTIDEVRAHFDAIQPTVASPPPVMPGARPLTEQLAIAAAEPKPRILAIAGSDQTLKNIRSRFRGRYEVITSSDAEASLDKIIAYQPDILVLTRDAGAFDPLQFLQLLRINRQLAVPHHVFLGAPPDGSGISRTGQSIGNAEIDRLSRDLDNIVHESRFHRQRKRLDYREILRREDPEMDDD